MASSHTERQSTKIVDFFLRKNSRTLEVSQISTHSDSQRARKPAQGLSPMGNGVEYTSCTHDIEFTPEPLNRPHPTTVQPRTP